jgi:hypothetical protein
MLGPSHHADCFFSKLLLTLSFVVLCDETERRFQLSTVLMNLWHETRHFSNLFRDRFIQLIKYLRPCQNSLNSFANASSKRFRAG